MKEKPSSEDLAFEIKFYEDLLKKEPHFVEALSALGDLYTKAGEYTKGLTIDRKLAVLKPDDPIVQYNLACSYSLLNELDESLKAIKRAIHCGYNDLFYLEKDRDLLNLRQDQRFKEYFAAIKHKHA